MAMNLSRVARCSRCCVLVMLLLASLSASAVAQVKRLSFGFYRNSTYEFTLGDAQSVISKMNTMLADDVGSGDVPCTGFNYELDGPPARYSNSLPTRVVGDEDVLAFRSSPFTVHIVASIQFCGEAVSAEGCSFP